MHLFYYYCWRRFGYSLLVVLSRASSLYLSPLPPFYDSVLPAWQKVNGGFSNRSDTLAICASGGVFQQDVWKVSHGVLYTASWLISFGYSVPLLCFCGPVRDTLVHLFFDCPLAQPTLSWLQSLMFRWSCLAHSLECRHVCFGFNSHELRTVPRVFCYLLNVV